MKKLTKKIGISFMALVGVLGLGTQFAHAAADADLTAGLASTTAIFTDNKSIIIGFFVGVIGIALIIGVAIAASQRGRRMITGAVGGGKKKR